MSLLRKLGFAGAFLGLSGIASESVSRPVDYRSHFNSVSSSRGILEELKQREIQRRLCSFSYEEWKTAIENPCSKEAIGLKLKARFMRDNPEITKSILSDEEKEAYNQFWRYFIIDVKKLKLDDKNPEYRDALLNYGLPIIIEMQVDIDRTYAPIETGGDVRNFFDYSNLNEGQKVLIFQHFRHEAKYYSEGGKRKSVFDKK